MSSDEKQRQLLLLDEDGPVEMTAARVDRDVVRRFMLADLRAAAAGHRGSQDDT